MLSFWEIFNKAAVSRYLSNSIFLHEINSKDKFLKLYVLANSSLYFDDEDLSKMSNFVLLISVAKD